MAPGAGRFAPSPSAEACAARYCIASASAVVYASAIALERQIEAVHTTLPERAPMCTVWRDSVVEPPGHHLCVGFSPGTLNVG